MINEPLEIEGLVTPPKYRLPEPKYILVNNFEDLFKDTYFIQVPLSEAP